LASSLQPGTDRLMFELTLKGRQRISQNDVVRQTIPQMDSGDRAGSTETVDSLIGNTTRQLLEPTERSTRRSSSRNHRTTAILWDVGYIVSASAAIGRDCRRFGVTLCRVSTTDSLLRCWPHRLQTGHYRPLRLPCGRVNWISLAMTLHYCVLAETRRPTTGCQPPGPAGPGPGYR